MSCSDWETRLIAFADGEVSAEQAADLRAHLEQCPCCRELLGQMRSQRAALVRLWAGEGAPSGLRERVRSTVAQAAFEPVECGVEVPESGVIDEPCHSSDRPRDGWSSTRRVEREDEATFDRGSCGGVSYAARRRRRLGFALATVGALAIGFALYQALLPPGWIPREVTVVPGDRLAAVRQLHSDAVAARGTNLTLPGKGDPGLSSEMLSEVAERLGAIVDLRVIAPDLAGAGFEIVAAGPVDVGSFPGAQVLYRSRAEPELSVFTVPRMEGLPTAEPRRGARSFFASTLNKTSVVGWHEGAQTYMLCADVTQEALFQLVDRVPTAERGLFESMRSVLAMNSGL